MARSRSPVPAPVQNARLFISSLLGGVGRQAPSRRSITEAENLDNVWVSVERNVEKRAPLEIVPVTEDGSPNGFILQHSIDGVGPFFYRWLEFSESETYLLVIDLGVTRAANHNLYWVYALDADTQELEDHTPADQYTDISADVWSYVQHGSPDPRSEIKVCSVGLDILVLNTKVKAGFTSAAAGITLEDGSTAVGNKLFDLDGVEGATTDTNGRKIEYRTSVKVDPSGQGFLWNPYTSIATGSIVYLPVAGNGGEAGVWRAKQDILNSGTYPPKASDTTNWEYLRAVDYIAVEGNRYPDPAEPWIGQAVPSFVDIKFPPLSGDSSAYYGVSDTVTTITALYGSAGGKVYYTENPYQDSDPGYYQIISESTQPYTRKIRTPDNGSILDGKRMPMRLRYHGKTAGISQWSFSQISWDPRTSGDRTSNPGPSVFSDGRQAEITAVTFYRNRVWFAARDTVFSSAVGDYNNFFLGDPGNITDNDPIDVAASWNRYVKILDMLPFDTFLFVNTDSDVQFQIKGSDNNKLTALTVQMSPTTAYATSPLAEPVVIGSQIYFLAPQRLYMYIPNDIAINTAAEMTIRAPGYIPTNPRRITTSPTHDCILVVDDDSPADIYLYVNRFQGTQVLQSSFFRWRLQESDATSVEVMDMHTIGNQLYLVLKKSVQYVYTDKVFVERVYLDPALASYPILDNRYAIEVVNGVINTALDRSAGGYCTCEYDSSSGTTMFLFPYYDEQATYVVLGSDWGDQANIALEILERNTTDGLWMTVVVEGDYSTEGATVYLGHPAVYHVQLSPQFYRDKDGQVVDGVLNLRTLHVRHHDTGAYTIFAQCADRPATVDDVIAAMLAGDTNDYTQYLTVFDAASASATLPTELTEADGETVATIMEDADFVGLHILSVDPSPCNITNMELHGIFRTRYRSRF